LVFRHGAVIQSRPSPWDNGYGRRSARTRGPPPPSDWGATPIRSLRSPDRPPSSGRENVSTANFLLLGGGRTV
jgi:hypothetical protein